MVANTTRQRPAPCRLLHVTLAASFDDDCEPAKTKPANSQPGNGETHKEQPADCIALGALHCALPPALPADPPRASSRLALLACLPACLPPPPELADQPSRSQPRRSGSQSVSQPGSHAPRLLATQSSQRGSVYHSAIYCLATRHLYPHENRHPGVAQYSASHRIASHPSHPPHHIIFGLKRRPQARLGGHRLGPVGSDWTVTSSLPTSAPRQNGAGALVGRQSVSVSVSVSVSGQRTVYYLVVRCRLGSGSGLEQEQQSSIPPDPRSKPPHQGPVDKAAHRLPLFLPPSSLPPGVFPRFLLPAVCLPRSACRFWDWTWGTRSRAKHFPISLRGSVSPHS